MTEQRITGPWDFDLHYIAVGYEEMRARVATGWKVYNTALIEHDRSSPGARIRIVAPIPYYFLGRTFTEDERNSQDAAEAASAEAAEASVAGLAPPAEAEKPDDEPPASEESPAPAEPTPPVTLGSRTARRRPEASQAAAGGQTATAARKAAQGGASVEGFDGAPRGARR